MGGLLHFFDFNTASRKSNSSKKHDALEAPRNSIELPVETIQSYDATEEYIPYSYQVVLNSTNCNDYNLNGVPVKRLIDEEIQNVPDVKRNVPNVVARLMGMDMLPSETRSSLEVKTKTDELTANNFFNKEDFQNASVRRSPDKYHSKQTVVDSPHHTRERDHNQPGNTLYLEKPRPREHPQEEELQKFKKEFEAWQAARAWEQSKVVELDSVPRQWCAREDLDKEKNDFHANSTKLKPNENPLKFQDQASQLLVKAKSRKKIGSMNQGNINEQVHGVRNQPSALKSNSTTDDDVEQYYCTHDKQEKSSAPTRIVIMKPGPNANASYGESWASSSESVDEEGSMKDFLEEVKEKLRLEMQGKSIKRDIVVRGGGIETPFSEKPSIPRKIARHITNQIREGVTKDHPSNLTRSESTRSYGSETQINVSGSPEFLDKATRILLSQKLRNVLNHETQNTKEGTFIPTDILMGNIYWENIKDEKGLQVSSFRHEHQNDVLHMGDMSPRSLVRSMSAPVSGTSFGRLLLEDRNVLTGAHIRRRQEAIEKMPVEVRKSRKEKSSLKGKVSNLRSRFTFKGKLFGRKLQSVDESWSKASDLMNDFMSGPTVLTSFGYSQENSTEVPPSPASVCRTPELPCSPMVEDQAMSKVFRDITSNIEELKRHLDHLENGSSKDMSKLEAPQELETNTLEDAAEVYVKNLLIVSGFYDESYDKLFSKWDPFSKPLSNWVFEKVEETYSKVVAEDEARNDLDEIKIDRKVLFDLSNEALSALLRPPPTLSAFKRKVMWPSRKELFDTIWKMIRIYVYPPNEGLFYSLPGMISRDMDTNPWTGMMQTDVDIIGKDIGNLIFEKLLEETIKDIWL